MKALRPEEVAERWQCSKSHIHKLIANGSLDAFRIGGRLWRISEGAVEEFEKCHPGSDLSSTEDYITSPGKIVGLDKASAVFPFVPRIVKLPHAR